MSIIISNIQDNSLAQNTPIKSGYEIISIDKMPINDILDLMFYAQKDVFSVEYKDKNNQLKIIEIINTFDKPLGFEVDLPKCVNCVNNCVFCFVDQIPKGLRKSLYIKDDDFIYSFFYGNFITLTNLKKKTYDKIIKQHISPLYVSVHTTNPVLHKEMLNYSIDFNIIKVLKKLNQYDIEIHAQIVVIPDINDKAELFKTLTDLVEMENISTIGIVPIGLTKHRDGLTPLKKFTKEQATELINHIEFMKNMRELNHIQCADELFILAEMPIPEDSYYGNYDQIENGIGMTRKTWENWKYIKNKFLRFLSNINGNPVFVTSVSGIQAINPILKEIQRKLPEKQIKAHVIKNNLFGDEVTVTGLLSWQDIKNQLNLADNEYPVFSSAVFNHDMITIDDFTITNIKETLNRNIVIVNELFTDWQIPLGQIT
jgi:putative radical SAM enzyme (TIGR03279 family)